MHPQHQQEHVDPKQVIDKLLQRIAQLEYAQACLATLLEESRGGEVKT